ncbi:hypothetical protein GCM10017596_07950 [Microbacterium keratanolyticum]|uniref:Uncharacterized protein n=1 Tax=Microbacterium keratanolyticum TaxID=67574 RepID=A0A9W6HS53_9MICO|nr:hypothetical protein GCM10017596_07950 [Microbacterium keratanolyticum]
MRSGTASNSTSPIASVTVYEVLAAAGSASDGAGALLHPVATSARAMTDEAAARRERVREVLFTVT